MNPALPKKITIDNNMMKNGVIAKDKNRDCIERKGRAG